MRCIKGKLDNALNNVYRKKIFETGPEDKDLGEVLKQTPIKFHFPQQFPPHSKPEENNGKSTSEPINPLTSKSSTNNTKGSRDVEVKEEGCEN